MRTTLGTPLTLNEAIKNAQENRESVKAHVKDFLSQKFSSAIIRAELNKEFTHEDLRKLFEDCTK